MSLTDDPEESTSISWKVGHSLQIARNQQESMLLDGFRFNCFTFSIWKLGKAPLLTYVSKGRPNTTIAQPLVIAIINLAQWCLRWGIPCKGCIQFQPCFKSIDMGGIHQSGRILCAQSSEILAPWDASKGQKVGVVATINHGSKIEYA